jgi:hypothetical protein
MRWTRWILAIVVGFAGTASGGQPACNGCGGGSAGWQAYAGDLSGEAGCSPPGFTGPIASRGCGCCCVNHQPCCNNAWDGYCEHHAKVQAFLSRVGMPKTRCYAGTMSAAPMRSCSACSVATTQPAPPSAQPAPRAVQPTPPPAPLPPSPASPPPSTTPPPPRPVDNALRATGQLWVR